MRTRSVRVTIADTGKAFWTWNIRETLGIAEKNGPDEETDWMPLLVKMGGTPGENDGVPMLAHIKLLQRQDARMRDVRGRATGKLKPHRLMVQCQPCGWIGSIGRLCQHYATHLPQKAKVSQ